MIAAKVIEYNTFKSTYFNLIADVAFDSDEGESDSFLEREAISTENYNGKLKRVYGYKYTNTFSPKFTFVKEDFSDITRDELRAIYAWLTGKSTPSFLTVYDQDGNSVLFECLGAFIEPKPYKLANNRTVGVTAVFESVLPWAVSQLNSYDLTTPTYDQTAIQPDTLSYTTQEIKVKSDDLDSPVYPKITINQCPKNLMVSVNTPPTNVQELFSNTMYTHYNTADKTTTYYYIDKDGNLASTTKTDDGAVEISGLETTSIKIINTYDDKQYIVTIIHNIAGETIVLDGANKIVHSERWSGRTFGSDFNWNWLPLYNGINNIEVIGNCQVTLEFRTPIKIGEW